MGLRGWRVDRKKNFCITDTQQSAVAGGVAHHRAASPTTEWTVSSPRPASAPTHCSAREGSVERALLHKVLGACSGQVWAPGTESPTCHQKDKQPLGFVHILQRGRKSSGSVRMAHSPQHGLSKGLGTPHPNSPRGPHPDPSGKMSPGTNLLTTTFLQTLSCCQWRQRRGQWRRGQRRRQLSRLSYYHQPICAELRARLSEC